MVEAELELFVLMASLLIFVLMSEKNNGCACSKQKYKQFINMLSAAIHELVSFMVSFDHINILFFLPKGKRQLKLLSKKLFQKRKCCEQNQ